MRITFLLLNPHASVDMAEGWVLKRICVAMSNVPVSTSDAFHGAQAQWLPTSTVETSSIASPLSMESRYLDDGSEPNEVPVAIFALIKRGI